MKTIILSKTDFNVGYDAPFYTSSHAGYVDGKVLTFLLHYNTMEHKLYEESERRLRNYLKGEEYEIIFGETEIDRELQEREEERRKKKWWYRLFKFLKS